MWTVNFQMFKLDLEESEEPEIKLPTSVGSSKKQGNSRKASAAAAAVKLLQLCPTLCDSIDGSPPGSPIPGILQARTLEWVAISFSNAGKWKVKVKLLSCVWLFVTLWTKGLQVSLSITNFWNLLRLMSIKSVVPSNHLIICNPLLLLPSIFPSIRVFF